MGNLSGQMPDREHWTHTDSDLLPVLEELRRNEPIFHTPAFGGSIADFDRWMDPGYWEVGASGRRYSREFLLKHLEENPPVLASEAGWESFDYACRRVGPDTFLMTYVLRQGDRLTRRATLWQRRGAGWSILYHQGTVADEEV